MIVSWLGCRVPEMLADRQEAWNTAWKRGQAGAESQIQAGRQEAKNPGRPVRQEAQKTGVLAGTLAGTNGGKRQEAQYGGGRRGLNTGREARRLEHWQA